MSHHSDDVFVAGSESFWEPGHYKRTTKRIEDGYKLCTDLMTLVSERAEIEKAYAKQLKNWASKWNNIIEKGPEYGTTEAAWKGVLVEADRRYDLHTRVKDRLNMEVIDNLKKWQKENYQKSMMQIKQKKEMEEQFKKAQKPWSKLLHKVDKAKLDYHNACKNEKTAVNQERNASSDSALSQDQVRKLQDRVSKAKDQVQRCKENYEVALMDINNYNAKYMEDMTDVFERCQRFEAQRLQQFKETLFQVQKCLNISEDPVLPQIYEEFYHTINNADHEKDLRLWSNTHGVNMAMNWPQFEEYSEEFRDISGKGKKVSAIPEGNITLINQRSVGDDLPPPEFLQRHTHQRRSLEYNPSKVNGGSHKAVGDSRSNGHSTKASSQPPTASTGIGKTANNTTETNHRTELSNGSAVKEANPFDDEDWDDDHADPLVDDGQPGVLVRALYDYEAAEDDELDFKAGDTFEKLEDEDEQGWCKGRKDGKVGLYPANYIEVIGN